ncbi:MAG: hypothetical protein KatS3mg129_0575 [Leptospiraceae bacterium]|nr:MAG: hypothetical protein KatS3mg129_0575 [Leptospiraceae bacterium]
MMKYSIFFLISFISCTIFFSIKQEKKYSDLLPFYTEKIHWNQYYYIIKIPKYNQRYIEDYGNKNHIFLKNVHSDYLYLYYKIPTKYLNSIKKTFSFVEVVNDFPFIWWDNDLNERKLNSLPILLNGYKDYEAIIRILQNLQKKYPDYIKLIELGKTYQNKTIYLIHLTNHKKKDLIKIPLYFNALHHGNELLTIEYILDMIFLLLGETYIDIPMPEQFNKYNLKILTSIPEEKRKKYLNAFDIFIIPIVNPDGLENFWYKSIHQGRKNSRSVDLNRNYPFFWNSFSFDASSSNIESYKFRGYFRGSEKETQIIMDFINKNPCSFSISYHTFAKKILVPYTIDYLWNPIPDRAYYFAKKLIQNSYSFRKENYKLARKLYSVDGTDQDWIYNKTGCIAYIVEGSMNIPDFSIAKYSIIGIRNVWYNLLDLALKGRRIELEFYYFNQPVEPNIKILNYYYFEKESFLFYRNRWIFYLGPLEKIKINVEYKNISKNYTIICRHICREKIHLTKK